MHALVLASVQVTSKAKAFSVEAASSLFDFILHMLFTVNEIVLEEAIIATA